MKNSTKNGSFFTYSELFEHRYYKLSKALMDAMEEKSDLSKAYANDRAKKLGILTGRTIRIEKLR